MALMFDEGRGRVITEISIWLTQSDEVLQAAGALVIGNCARTSTVLNTFLKRHMEFLLIDVFR
jgi:hypothetical protein